MKIITPQIIVNLYEKNGYPLYKSTKEKPFNINIYGIRSNDQDTSTYNDLIGCLYFDAASNSWINQSYLGTTDPGLYYLLNPINPKGTAYLLPGYYQGVYKCGYHGGPKSRHYALVQIKPMLYQRDNNKNRTLDPDKTTYKENAATNLHSGWDNSIKHLINHDSAGCQVIASHKNQIEFMHLIDKSKQYYGDIFSYALFTEQDL